MKHFKRSVLTKNLSTFLLCGPLFVFVSESYYQGLSAFDLDRLYDFFSGQSAYNLMLILSLYTVFWVKRLSLIVLPLFFAMNIFLGIQIFIGSLDKLLLILNFIYLGASFIFITFWSDELQDAIYNPFFTPQDIEKRSGYNLIAELVDQNGGLCIASITNWDKEGCFMNILDGAKIPKGTVEIKMEFNGIHFDQRARVMTNYDKGIGIKFILDKRVEQEYNWNELYELINDMGYKPRLI